LSFKFFNENLLH